MPMPPQSQKELGNAYDSDERDFRPTKLAGASLHGKEPEASKAAA